MNEEGRAGIGCNKFYEAYGKKGLTGGLMAAWCPHLVCLGFHCIPKGEGRNDVFSALFTRWRSPPEIVIYDFACALGPYCMLREPAFFVFLSLASRSGFGAICHILFPKRWMAPRRGSSCRQS